MDVAVTQLDPDRPAHVQLYRAVRLRALEADPDAFGSNLERESAFDDAQWQQRVAGYAGRPGVVFAARPAAALQLPATAAMGIGIIGVGASERPADATIWGMWVAPSARGTGVSGRLLDAAEQWAKERELASVSLWVRRANAAAVALYRRHGFVDTEPDDSDPVPDGCNDEQLMRRRLDRR